ncbi:hypothetical protein C8J57DRAFT_1359843, partial [Mycena rebaudengoi]
MRILPGHLSLPIELEREIFETAAFLHPVRMPTLILVARRVQAWIERILYRDILLTNGEQTRLLLRTLAESRGPRGTAATRRRRLDYVRNLGVLSYFEHVPEILRVCEGVSNLAMLGGTTITIARRTHYQLRRLTIDILARSVKQPKSICARLTHLDIRSVLGRNVDDWTVWAGLARLSLTHLALHIYHGNHRRHFYWTPIRIIQGALRECKSLEVLVLVFCIDVCSDAVANWVGECRGGDHFWARADEFIAKKKLGQVAASEMWVSAN